MLSQDVFSCSKDAFQRAGKLLFMVLGFSIFIAKPPINISYALLMAMGLAYWAKFKPSFLGRNPYVIILLIPFLLGAVGSLFALEGSQGFLFFIHRYRFLLLVIPFALFIRSPKDLIFILLAMNAGALVDIVFFLINSDLNHILGRVHGFHKFGRHSDMMFTLSLLDIGFLAFGFKSRLRFPRSTWVYGFIGLSVIPIFISVWLIGQRGAYLGLYVGLVSFCLLYSKRLLWGLALATLCFALLAPHYVISRTKTIVDTRDTGSNRVRLKLFRIGTDMVAGKELFFRGVGDKKRIEQELEIIFADKSPEYREKYYSTFKMYPDNFHNSYLQMAVEAGLVFPILYLFGIGYLLLSMFQKKGNGPLEKVVFPSIIMAASGFLVTEIFHEEFFRYGGLVFFIMFYGACLVENTRGRSAHLSPIVETS